MGFKRAFPLNVTVGYAHGDGQSCCIGCSIHGLGTGGRHWTSSLLVVSINYNRVGLFCGDCFHSLLSYCYYQPWVDTVVVNGNEYFPYDTYFLGRFLKGENNG